MKIVAAYRRRLVYRSVLSALAVSLSCVGTACREAAPNPKEAASNPPAEAEKTAEMQKPVTSFRQVLTSSTTELTLHPAQDATIPVRIQNPGTETWISSGQYPVNVSYKWFKAGQMMGIEGERTSLPSAVGPNQAVDAEVRVVAPPNPGKYALRLTLVQEGVAWFMLKSRTFLELPATIK